MRRMPLEDLQVPIRYRLSALWAATMLCYLYGDYFTLYKPGMLQALLDGQLEGMGPVSQGVLVAMAGIMTVPALMVALSLLLPAMWARRANIVFGLAYSLLMAVSMLDMWWYYKMLGVVEIALTLGIARLAWRWPRTAEATSP